MFHRFEGSAEEAMACEEAVRPFDYSFKCFDILLLVFQGYFRSRDSHRIHYQLR